MLRNIPSQIYPFSSIFFPDSFHTDEPAEMKAVRLKREGPEGPEEHKAQNNLT